MFCDTKSSLRIEFVRVLLIYSNMGVQKSGPSDFTCSIYLFLSVRIINFLQIYLVESSYTRTMLLKFKYQELSFRTPFSRKRFAPLSDRFFTPLLHAWVWRERRRSPRSPLSLSVPPHAMQLHPHFRTGMHPFCTCAVASRRRSKRFAIAF